MAFLHATEEILNWNYSPRKITHTKITVGATTTPVVSVNPDRKYLLLVNDNDVPIYINLGGSATVNTGIRINANGGSYEMSGSLGNLYLGAINAIATGGSKVLLVTEGA